MQTQTSSNSGPGVGPGKESDESFDQEPREGDYDYEDQHLEVLGIQVPLENMFVAFILVPALFGGFGVGVKRALENAKSEATEGLGSTPCSNSLPGSNLRSRWEHQEGRQRKPPMVPGNSRVEKGRLSRLFLRGATTPQQVAWRALFAGTAACITTAATGALATRAFFGVDSLQDVRDGEFRGQTSVYVSTSRLPFRKAPSLTRVLTLPLCRYY